MASTGIGLITPALDIAFFGRVQGGIFSHQSRPREGSRERLRANINVLAALVANNQAPILREAAFSMILEAR